MEQLNTMMLELALLVVGLIIIVLNSFKKELVRHAPMLAKLLFRKIHNKYSMSDIGKISSKINNYLEQIAVDYDAGRVAIYQLSNGKHYFSGQAIIKADVSDVHIKRRNVTKIPYIPFNIIKCLLQALVSDKVASFKRTGCDTNENFLSYYKISDCILHRLDIDNEFVGFIEILDPKREGSKISEEAVNRLGGLFEAGRV